MKRRMFDYEVIDYDESVDLPQIINLILDGYEILPHADDFDLNYAVYIKQL